MPEKDPSSFGWITYAWVMMVSAAGGLVNFHRKMREGTTRPFSLTEFVGELFTSAFTGIITFWLCEWQGVAPLLSAALIAISGHMGSRALFGIEKWVEQRYLGRLGK